MRARRVAATVHRMPCGAKDKGGRTKEKHREQWRQTMGDGGGIVSGVMALEWQIVRGRDETAAKVKKKEVEDNRRKRKRKARTLLPTRQQIERRTSPHSHMPIPRFPTVHWAVCVHSDTHRSTIGMQMNGVIVIGMGGEAQERKNRLVIARTAHPRGAPLVIPVGGSYGWENGQGSGMVLLRGRPE